MNIIIDGYNLLKQIMKKDPISDRERAWFLNLAAAYAAQKKHVMYIIYDGGPYDRPTSEKRGNVTIVYSGRNLSADDVIKTYIDEKFLKDMLVVTTDRQLNRYAGRNNIPSIDSIDFYGFMRGAKPPTIRIKKVAGRAHKLHEDEGSTELDALMQEGSSVLFYKDEKDAQTITKGNKSSKEEKVSFAILKKL